MFGLPLVTKGLISKIKSKIKYIREGVSVDLAVYDETWDLQFKPIEEIEFLFNEIVNIVVILQDRELVKDVEIKDNNMNVIFNS